MRISRRLRIVSCALACAWAVVGWPGVALDAQTPNGLDRGQAVRTFTERISRYVMMRARLEAPLPSFEARRDPWSLMLTRRYLASAIRTARPHARLGDIFATPVSELFQSVIADAIYDIDIEGLVGEGFDVEDFVVDVQVNEPVPAWTLENVPDSLLARLPVLPEAVAYRLVGGDLILWDLHAEIVIDALPNAFLVQ